MEEAAGSNRASGFIKMFFEKNIEIGINNSSNDTILIDDLEEHNWEDSFLFDYEELDFDE